MLSYKLLGNTWMIFMSYVKGILREEYERLKALSAKYNSEILMLPKGSISVKKRNQKEYLYLAYRAKDKVKFEYIGPLMAEKAKDVMKKVELRKEYENKLKQVKKDLLEIKKVINGKKL